MKSATGLIFRMSSAKRHHVPREPAFVVGMSDSRTTMALDRLGVDPQLFDFRLETLFLPSYLAGPEDVLREICGFLGAAYDNAVLKTQRVRPKLTGHSSSEITPNRSYRSLLEERDYAERIERIAGKELSARDCDECSYPNSEGSVSRFDRLAFYWTDAKDYLAQMFTEKADTRSYLTWSLFLSRIKATA